MLGRDPPELEQHVLNADLILRVLPAQ